MEPAKIDWKNMAWVFVEDERYEHLNAPKWFDFSAPDDPVDDVAWFCRADCNHPNTVEDFLKSTPTSKKQANAYKTLLFGEVNQRDASIKRRGFTPCPKQSNASPEDAENQNPNLSSENQNPNLSTPKNHHVRSLKAAIKSSSEKKKAIDEPPKLKSTLSARNLFGGRNIFSHITEFVGELKKLTSRPKEREENIERIREGNEVDLKVSGAGETLEDKERKPLLEVSEGKSDGSPMSIVKEKKKLNRIANDGENTPISLNMENVRSNGREVLGQIRTSPPTPQCFSASRGPTRTTPQKGTKSRLMIPSAVGEKSLIAEGVPQRNKERQILQEVKVNKEVAAEIENKPRISNFDVRDAKPLDLFWLLKPCTPSS